MEENVVIGAGAKVLGAICIGTNTRVGAGSVVVKDVAANSTVVGIPGRVVNQSGVKINPLAHSALPDTEANVIQNLMDRIDNLENQNAVMQDMLAASKILDININKKLGKSQSLKDKEIIQFIGEAEDMQN